MQLYEILILAVLVGLSLFGLYYKLVRNGGCGCGKSDCCKSKRQDN